MTLIVNHLCIDMPGKQYIFGYGSLVSVEDVARTLGRAPSLIHPVTLKGWVREWGVVIDNTKAEHRCVRLADGRIAPGYIAVLNVRLPAAGERPTDPNGVLFEVTEADLRKIDERETHYERLDVTDSVVNKPTGTIYAYTGHDRFLLAAKAWSDIVIPGAYHDLVERGFASLGPKMSREYLSSTLPSSLPIHRQRMYK
jgi:hypothetical protein